MLDSTTFGKKTLFTKHDCSGWKKGTFEVSTEGLSQLEPINAKWDFTESKMIAKGNIGSHSVSLEHNYNGPRDISFNHNVKIWSHDHSVNGHFKVMPASSEYNKEVSGAMEYKSNKFPTTSLSLKNKYAGWKKASIDISAHHSGLMPEPLPLQAKWDLTQPKMVAMSNIGSHAVKFEHHQNGPSDFTFNHNVKIWSHDHTMKGHFKVAPASGDYYQKELSGSLHIESNKFAKKSLVVKHNCSGWKKGSLDINHSGVVLFDIPVSSKWDFTQPKMIVMANVGRHSVNFEHHHQGPLNFSFKHNVNVLSHKHSVSGHFNAGPYLNNDQYTHQLTGNMLFESNKYNKKAFTVKHNCAGWKRGELQLSHESVISQDTPIDAKWDLEMPKKTVIVNISKHSVHLEHENKGPLDHTFNHQINILDHKHGLQGHFKILPVKNYEYTHKITGNMVFDSNKYNRKAFTVKHDYAGWKKGSFDMSHEGFVPQETPIAAKWDFLVPRPTTFAVKYGSHFLNLEHSYRGLHDNKFNYQANLWGHAHNVQGHWKVSPSTSDAYLKELSGSLTTNSNYLPQINSAHTFKWNGVHKSEWQHKMKTKSLDINIMGHHDCFQRKMLVKNVINYNGDELYKQQIHANNGEYGYEFHHKSNPVHNIQVKIAKTAKTIAFTGTYPVSVNFKLNIIQSKQQGMQIIASAGTMSVPDIAGLRFDYQIEDNSFASSGKVYLFKDTFSYATSHTGNLRQFQHKTNLFTNTKLVTLQTSAVINSLADIKIESSVISNGVNKLSVLFSNQGSLTNTKHELKITKMEDAELFRYIGEININDSFDWSVEGTVTEAFTPLKMASVKMAVDDDNMEIKVRQVDKFIHLNVKKATYTTPYLVELRSSCPVARHLMLKVQTSNKSPMKTDISVEARYNRHVVLATMEYNSVTKIVRMSLKTPFKELRTLNTDIKTSFRYPKEATASVQLEINGLKYSTTFVIKNSLSEYEPSGELLWMSYTPHAGFKRIGFNIVHKGTFQKFDCKVSANFDTKSVQLTTKREDSSLMVGLALPVEGFTSLSMNIDKAEDKEYGTGYKIHTMLPYDKFATIYGHGNLINRGLRSSSKGIVKIITSEQALKNMEFVLDHIYENDQLKHASSIILNKNQIHNLAFGVDTGNGELDITYPEKLNIKYKIQVTPIIEAELKITYRDMVPIHFIAQHDRTAFKIDSTSFVSLQTPHRVVMIKRKIKIQPNKFSYNLEFTPNKRTTKPVSFTIVSTDKSIYNSIDQATTMTLVLPTRTLETEFFAYKMNEAFELKSRINWDASRTKNDKEITLQAVGSYVSYKKLQVKVSLATPLRSEPFSAELSTKYKFERELFSTNLVLDITTRKEDIIIIDSKISKQSNNGIKVFGRFLQRSSNIDMAVESEYNTNMDQRKAKIVLHYTDVNNVRKSAQIYLRNAANKIEFDIATPSRKVNGVMRKVITPEYTGYEISTQGTNLEIRIMKSLGLALIYEPRTDDKIYAGIGYKTDRHVQLDIHRMAGGVKMQHILGEIELKSHHLFHTKFHWNPSYALLQYATLRDKIPTLYRRSQNYAMSWKGNFIRDVYTKVTTDIILPDLSVAGRQIATELNEMKKDFGFLSQQFDNMYRNNEFYMQTIAYKAYIAYLHASYQYSQLTNALNYYTRYYVLPSMRWTYYHLYINYQKSHSFVRYHAGRCYRHINNVYETVQDHSQNVYNKVNDKVFDFIDLTVDSIRPGLNYTYNQYQKLANTYTYYHFKILGHPAVQMIKLRVARSVESMNYQIFDHLHTSIRSHVINIHNSIQKQINDFSDTTSGIIGGAKIVANKHIDNLMKNKHTELATYIVKGAYDGTKWVLDRFNVEENLKQFAKDNYLQTAEYLRANSIGIATSYIGLHKNRVLVNENGKFEAQIHSPLKWKNLKSMPESGLDDIKDRMNENAKNLRNSIQMVQAKIQAAKDIVYDSIPDFDMPAGAWFPKFKAFAGVSGDHIVTFDKHHYDFKGDCTYLLTGYKNWAVSMTYRKTGKVLNIHAYNKMIRIMPNMHVFVDGERQELPYTLNKLTIVRYNNVIVAKDMGNLFTATADSKYDTYTVGISRWYHNKLSGLFGNLDNEAFNDMQTLEGKPAESVYEFTMSWKMGPCKHVNYANWNNTKSEETSLCKRLFQSPLSPFRKCFKYVDPKPFLAMCSEEKETKGLCSTASLYTNFCWKEGMKNLPMPDPCVDCSLQGESFPVGSVTNINFPSTKKVDVVFVIEERGCLGAKTLQNMQSVVDSVQQKFSVFRISDIKFGLKGFGNPEHFYGKSKVHTHTIRGELASDAEGMKEALSKLHLYASSDKKTDPLDAVHNAARFTQWRPDAARHIVLVSCQECQEGRRTQYSVQTALEEAGITFHIHTRHNYNKFVFKTENIKDRKLQVFAQESEELYKLPGICASFAKTISVQNGLVTRNAEIQKAHNDAFATKIVESTKLPVQQRCVCKSSCGNGALLCSVTASKSLNRLSSLPFLN